MSEPTVVWVLDLCGYDARGGNARVFSSLELAKAAVPDVTDWRPDRVEAGGVYEHLDNTSDAYEIYPRVLDDSEPPAWLAMAQAELDREREEAQQRRAAEFRREHPFQQNASGSWSRKP